MPARIYLIVFILCGIGCQTKHSDPRKLDSLLNGVDLSSVSEDTRLIVQKASEDYNAVVHFRKPIHAHVIGGALDGGTMRYQTEGYRLTVAGGWQSIDGNLFCGYGPVVHFDESLGLLMSFAHTSIFDCDELKAILEETQGTPQPSKTIVCMDGDCFDMKNE